MAVARERIGRLLLYLGLVGAWGLNYIFVREGLGYSPALWLALLRSAIGAVGVAAFLVATGRGTQFSPRDRRDALLLGLPNTTAFFGLWFLAAGAVAPGVAAVIVYTFPFWVALLSPAVLGSRIEPLQGAAIGIGFLGVLLVSQPWATGSALPVWAVGALLLGSLSWALGTVLFRRRFEGDQMRVANAYQLAGGSVGLLLVALAVEPGRLPAASLSLLAIVLYLGLVGTAFGYGVWFYLLSRTPAPTLSAYVFVVPVVALFAAFVVFGDAIDPVQSAGVALVLASIYATARVAARPAPGPAPGAPTTSSR